MNSCIQEISVDTQFIIKKLSTCKIGDVITYEELAKEIKRKVPNGILVTARKRLLTDERMVFGTIRKVGLKRLSDSEIVNTSTAALGSIQRATKREKKRLVSVDFENLPSNMKIKHSAIAATLAVVNEITKEKKQNRLESSISNENQKLSMVQTIETFENILKSE